MFWEVDSFLLFFRDEDGAFSGRAHGGHEEVIADDVKFLLVVAGDVAGACEAGQVDQGGSADVVGYRFEGKLEGVAEEARGVRNDCNLRVEVGESIREISSGLLMFCLLFSQEPS